MNKHTRLQNALESKERLRITYQGGSRPGAAREIEVEEVGREKIRALCHHSNITKTFVIAQINIIENDALAEAPLWRNENRPSPIPHSTLEEFYAEVIGYLQELGWHVNYKEAQLSLHRRFKTGKPLKGADVELVYEEYTSKTVFDFDTGELIEVDKKPRERPWTVRAKGATTRTYGQLFRAAGAFMEVAQKLALKT